jgi:hypothetical protein
MEKPTAYPGTSDFFGSTKASSSYSKFKNRLSKRGIIIMNKWALN